MCNFGDSLPLAYLSSLFIHLYVSLFIVGIVLISISHCFPTRIYNIEVCLETPLYEQVNMLLHMEML
jgi:hypothetical protein